ncbi:leucyl aminopeptidase [Planctomycetota bacterium]
MKAIINVSSTTRKVDLDKCRTDMLVVGVFSDARKLDKTNAQLDKKLNGEIAKLIKLGDFKGSEKSTAIIYTDGRIAANRVMLVGLGEKKKLTLDTLRKASAIAAKKSVEIKSKTLSLALHNVVSGQLDLKAVGQVAIEGAYFGSYRYDEFITESKNGRLSSLKVELVDADSKVLIQLKEGAVKGAVIGGSQSYARTIANRPGNVIYPAKLADIAKQLARNTRGLSCTVFDEKQLTAKGMGGILAVGSGSIHKPRFIILKYTPAGKVSGKVPLVALVGKAITFDSGGISLKPAPNMNEMKLDKSGGIAVLATMKAIAELRLPIKVYGLIPSAENLPGGASYRPGDIVNTFSGKTVEVLNTDAEGRMILCDALAYAVKQKCEVIVDAATLTGACLVALGKHKAGLMGNDDDLIRQLQKASENSGEKIWHLPCGDEYAEEMKSKIADLKNIGGKWGGACTAAAFLRQFIGETKWAHLDIAGMDLFSGGNEFTANGSSGFGVRLLTSFVMNLASKK